MICECPTCPPAMLYFIFLGQNGMISVGKSGKHLGLQLIETRSPRDEAGRQNYILSIIALPFTNNDLTFPFL